MSRLTKYTALPTLLDWPHHLRQRGHPSEEIGKRNNALRELYTSQDEAVVSKILQDYGVDYICVGDIKNQQYGHPATRLDKIAVTKEFFRSSSGQNLIFRVEPKRRGEDTDGQECPSYNRHGAIDLFGKIQTIDYHPQPSAIQRSRERLDSSAL